MKNEFYCACNSAEGFISFFEDEFFTGEINKRYIIKGGPGTGKSTLMKNIAEKAENKGYEVERYYCSSDIYSLDGVKIKEKGICIFDGTAPHSYDCKYPGSIDRIINMNEFWDDKILEENKRSVVTLTDACSASFKSAYSYLASAGSVIKNIMRCIRPHVNGEKLDIAAKNYADRFDSGEGRPAVKIIKSISGIGINSFIPDFLKYADIYYVQDKRCVAPMLFEKLIRHSKGEITVFRDPLMPELYEGVYFVGSNVFFTSDRGLISDKKYKVIHSQRFTDEYIKNNRVKIRFEEKLAQALTEQACKYLYEAKRIHDRLEEIYISAMDFDKKEKWTEEFISRLI